MITGFQPQKVVVFRTDASAEIGSGHFMRCLTLAHALHAHGAEIHFICTPLPTRLEAEFKRYPYTLHTIIVSDKTASNLCNQYEDAHATLTCLQFEIIKSVDCLVVDHYSLDSEWEIIITHAVSQILVVDDLANRKHTCRWLLDQNPRTTEDYTGLVPAHCLNLVGPRYALVREEFINLRRQAIQRRMQTESVRNLLVFYSHDADYSILQKSILAIQTINYTFDDIYIIAGTHKETLQLECSSLNIPSLRITDYDADIAESLLKADIVLGAAGSSSWERCVLGVPSLLVVLAPNQRLVANSQVKQGNAIYAGETATLTYHAVTEALKTILNSHETWNAMSKAAFELCDGLGARKVAQLLFNSPIDAT